MAPLEDRKQARKVAKAEHVASEKAIAEHILNKRDSEYANPPLKLPPTIPVLSQKLASTKEANRIAEKTAIRKASARAKIELDVNKKVAATAGAIQPPAIAPVWKANTSVEG